jgi:hypothetical protein
MRLDADWSELQTRDAWRAWLQLAKTESPKCADWWSSADSCADCRYFDAGDVWCNRVNAPATRNPVLDMLGMACCGAGYEPLPETQLSFFFVP